MSKAKRKPRLDADETLHPIAPPSSALPVEARLRAVEEALGVGNKVFVIDPYSKGPFTREKPGPNDLVVRLRRFDDPEPPPVPAVNVVAPEAIQ